MFCQSLPLYEIVQIQVEGLTNEFLPYISASVVWENLNYYHKALCELSKSIELMKAELQQLLDSTLQVALPDFENHLKSLYEKSHKPKNLSKKFQTMLYAGGMYANKYFSLNSRFGFVLNNWFNVSADLGLSTGSSSFFVNIGIMAYARYKFLMGGTGFNANIGKGGSFNYRIAGGFSFLAKSGNSSTDIMLNLDIPFTKNSNIMLGFSVGQSFYLGTRRKK